LGAADDALGEAVIQGGDGFDAVGTPAAVVIFEGVAEFIEPGRGDGAAGGFGGEGGGVAAGDPDVDSAPVYVGEVVGCGEEDGDVFAGEGGEGGGGFGVRGEAGG